MTGQRKTYHYDRLGRVTEHHHYPNTIDSKQPPIINYYQYDPIGRLIRKRSPDYVTEYHYKPKQISLTHSALRDWAMAQLAGQPLAAEQYQQLSFTIDELGQLITEQNHDGHHHYQYDSLGNLLTHTLPDGNQLSYFYYGSGHLSQLNLKTADKVYEIADYERDRLHRWIGYSN